MTQEWIAVPGGIRILAPMSIEAWAARRGVGRAIADVTNGGINPARRLANEIVVRAGIGGTRVLSGPGSADRLTNECSRLLVVGLCGAIGAGLETGDVIVATKVIAEADGAAQASSTESENQKPISLSMPHQLSRHLAMHGLRVATGPILTSERFVPKRRRRRLLESRGALGVDMESFWIVDKARRSGLPTQFGVVRVVLDPLDRGVISGRVAAQLPRALKSLSLVCQVIAELEGASCSGLPMASREVVKRDMAG